MTWSSPCAAMRRREGAWLVGALGLGLCLSLKRVAHGRGAVM
jgi:hypothetical protein